MEGVVEGGASWGMEVRLRASEGPREVGGATLVRKVTILCNWLPDGKEKNMAGPHANKIGQWATNRQIGDGAPGEPPAAHRAATVSLWNANHWRPANPGREILWHHPAGAMVKPMDWAVTIATAMARWRDAPAGGSMHTWRPVDGVGHA